MLTINLGTPKGSIRMAAVPIVVPAEPPRANTPETLPSACKRAMSCAAPFAAALHGAAAVCGGEQFRVRRAGGGEQLCSRNVGWQGRGAETPAVHQFHIYAGRL